jgi:hypothetical protein
MGHLGSRAVPSNRPAAYTSTTSISCADLQAARAGLGCRESKTVQYGVHFDPPRGRESRRKAGVGFWTRGPSAHRLGPWRRPGLVPTIGISLRQYDGVAAQSDAGTNSAGQAEATLLALRCCLDLLDKTKQAHRGHRQLENLDTSGANASASALAMAAGAPIVPPSPIPR